MPGPLSRTVIVEDRPGGRSDTAISPRAPMASTALATMLRKAVLSLAASPRARKSEPSATTRKRMRAARSLR